MLPFSTRPFATAALLAVVLVAARSAGASAAAPSVPAAASAATQATTDLHAAAWQGDAATVRRLAAAGADLNARDPFGSTPLIIAATFGRAEVARALVDAGADLGLRNAEGSTALHVAAFFGREAVVQALLSAGANRHLRNARERSAWDLATMPLAQARPVFDAVRRSLGPLGFQLDDAALAEVRPRIAAALQPTDADLAAVRFAPRAGGGWAVSTPQAEGLARRLVAALMLDTSELSTLYGVLVVRHGRLIAERYGHGTGPGQLSSRMSMTKSVVSALVGLALHRGCLTGLDQPMLGFFPELAERIDDPRKRTITVRHLLQMRAGYPWEGREPPWFQRLFQGDPSTWRWLPHLADFPLTADPGTRFAYSNLSSHILAHIVTRACRLDLHAFADDALFGPMGTAVGGWVRDPDGVPYGWAELALTARDMARFGQLMLDRGRVDGRPVLPAAWVDASLARYSEGINFTGPPGHSEAGRVLRDLGYGYQWWSARAGAHAFDMAWGHGGQLVVLLHDLDMVVVTTAEPLHHLPETAGWVHEGAIVDAVGRFIASLPAR